MNATLTVAPDDCRYHLDPLAHVEDLRTLAPLCRDCAALLALHVASTTGKRLPL